MDYIRTKYSIHAAISNINSTFKPHAHSRTITELRSQLLLITQLKSSSSSKNRSPIYPKKQPLEAIQAFWAPFWNQSQKIPSRPTSSPRRKKSSQWYLRKYVQLKCFSIPSRSSYGNGWTGFPFQPSNSPFPIQSLITSGFGEERTMAITTHSVQGT